MWIDGEWRETLGPTLEKANQIDGTKQTIDFCEHHGRTFGEVPTKRNRYVAHLMNGRDPDHLDVKKFAEWGK